MDSGLRFGTGIFALPEAARLVGVTPERMRTWMFGGHGVQPIVSPSPPIFEGEAVLSFADVVTALMTRVFREKGVPLPVIRRVAQRAAQEHSIERPFTLKDFSTDGRTLMQWVQNGRERALLEAHTGQVTIRKFVQPLLIKIDYGVDLQAVRWWPMGRARHVVVDPRMSFGEPTVSGVPTRVLSGPVAAGDKPKRVAEWFGVTRAEVLAACQFERIMSARAA